MHLKTVFASVLFAACAAFSAFGDATGTQRLYVDSNGGEYINTGFTPNANTSIAVQYQLLQAPDSSHNDYVFSEYGPSNLGRFQFVHLLDDKVFCGYGAGYRDISRTYDKDIHIVTCSNGVFKIDGVTVHTVASWAGTAKELFLFGGNADGSVKTGSMGYVRIFWCKIYNGATLVRDYVPWERDGVAGLLDRQNNVFYSSATATQLTAGPDVNRETLTVPAGVTTNFVTRTDLGRIEQIEKVVFKDPTATLVYSVSSGNGVPNTIAYEGAGTIRCEVESDAAAFDVATGVAFGSAAFDNFTGRIVIVSSETVGDKLTATFDSLPGDFGAITVTNGATLVFNCSGTPANGGLTFAGTGTPVVDVEAGCDVVISGAAAAPNGFVKTGFGILRLTGDRAEVDASNVTSKRGWLFLGDTLVINDSTYRETLADFGFTPILFGTEHCGSGNCGPENAFDGDSSITADSSKRYLASLNGPHPMIVYGVPGVKFTMTHYRLCQLRCGGYVIDRVPTKWKLEGGDTAAGPWTVIDQRSVKKTFWGGVNDPWRKFYLAEPQTYSFFKITFEESGLDKDNWRVGLMEIEYCGGAKTVPADWTEQKKGATVTIPANTILVVKSADVANVNALAKIVFADKTSILHYRGINNTVAPAVALEGEGTVFLKGATADAEWALSKAQTDKWLGTWCFPKGKPAPWNDSAFFAIGLPQLHDVYYTAKSSSESLLPRSNKVLQATRLFLGGTASISGDDYFKIRFCQIEVIDDAAKISVYRSTQSGYLCDYKPTDGDLIKSRVNLNGHKLTMYSGLGNSIVGFPRGCVRGPGTFAFAQNLRSDLQLEDAGDITLTNPGDGSFVAIYDGTNAKIPSSFAGRLALCGSRTEVAGSAKLALNGGTKLLKSGEMPDNGTSWMRVYEKGGAFVVTNFPNDVVYTSILEPQGNVIKSIPLSTEVANKVFSIPPTVKITDSTGSNAYAVVDFDYTTYKVTNITVVCGGENYTAPTATLNYADTTPVQPLTCEIGPCEGGDVTLAIEGASGTDKRIFLREHNHWDWHGTTTLDLDPEGVATSSGRALWVQNNGDNNTGCLSNTTKLVLKSGYFCVYEGSDFHVACPNCDELEIVKGGLGAPDGLKAKFKNVTVSGQGILKGSKNNNYWCNLTITNALIVDASLDAPAQLQSGNMTFEPGAKVTVKNYESLLADDWKTRDLFYMTHTVYGTPIVEVPEELEGKVALSWVPYTVMTQDGQKLVARRRTGVIIVVR